MRLTDAAIRNARLEALEAQQELGRGGWGPTFRTGRARAQ